MVFNLQNFTPKCQILDKIHKVDVWTCVCYVSTQGTAVHAVHNFLNTDNIPKLTVDEQKRDSNLQNLHF